MDQPWAVRMHVLLDKHQPLCLTLAGLALERGQADQQHAARKLHQTSA